jgi:DNA-binding IclR family transcriptional regulator
MTEARELVTSGRSSMSGAGHISMRWSLDSESTTGTITANMAKSKRVAQISSSNGAQTLARGLSVVQYLTAADEPQRASDIARAVDLDRNAVYRLLLELEAHSYVARVSERGGYVVGSGLIELAAMVMRKIDLRKSARPIMEQIGAETGETVSLHVRQDRSRVCVETVASKHAVRRVIQIGETFPLYAGPSGKAILAFMEPEEVDLILVQAQQAGQDADRIRDDLNALHANGYIASVGDRTPGVGGLSVPVFKADGIGAALTVSGPSSRWTQDAMDASAELVVRMCSALSASLGHMPS